MARITAIINQKGGVGKTTTTHALATGLTRRGYKTLLIDMDAQGNLTYAAGAQTGASIYEAMRGDISAIQAIQHTPQGDIIGSSQALKGADKEFSGVKAPFMVREAIKPVKEKYSHIVIDCPPTLGILSINAMTAATDIVIPMGADIFSLQGMAQLYGLITEVQMYSNPALKISGLLVTRYSGRTILNRDMKEVIENKAQELHTRLYNAVIREAVSIKEAQTVQASIFTHAPKSNGAQDYEAFITEYLKGE